MLCDAAAHLHAVSLSPFGGGHQHFVPVLALVPLPHGIRSGDAARRGLEWRHLLLFTFRVQVCEQDWSRAAEKEGIIDSSTGCGAAERTFQCWF